MNYRLKVGEEIPDLQVLKSENPSLLRFIVDNREHDVSFRVLGVNHYQLTVDGKSTEAFVVSDDQGKHVVLRGRSFFVQDADELPQRRARAGGDEDFPVTPPMPAVVVRILVKEGDRIKKGQGLVVVTAMKMETTLAAPKDGLVKRINTSVQAKVAPGDVLVEIEEDRHE